MICLWDCGSGGFPGGASAPSAGSFCFVGAYWFSFLVLAILDLVGIIFLFFLGFLCKSKWCKALLTRLKTHQKSVNEKTMPSFLWALSLVISKA